MSFGNYNNGCGCGTSSVYFAPPACNPNFPTYCSPLGATGTGVRVVVEDTASCKYTVLSLASNSILTYNNSLGFLSWGDGSVVNPIFLGNGSNQSKSSSNSQIQVTTPTGQLAAFIPATSTQVQFPVFNPSGSSSNWGTVENIIPSQGLVYKTGSTTDGSLSANTVYQLSGIPGDYVSFDNLGNPISVPSSVASGGYTYKSGAYTSIAGDRIAADTSGGTWTMILPQSPAFGTIVTIADASGTWTTNNLIVSPASGSTILGLVQNFIANISYWSITFYYNNITWIPIIV